MVAGGTPGLVGKRLVAPARLLVDLVARKAGHLVLAADHDVADILGDVAVGGVEPGDGGAGEVEPEAAEEVVAGNEVVRVGEAGTAGAAATQVAAGANGGHQPRRLAA